VVFEGPAGRTARLVLGQPRTGGPWPVGRQLVKICPGLPPV